MVTTTKQTNGIMTSESIDCLFPDSSNTTARTGGLGPFVVPLERLQKLTNLTVIQSAWGDPRPQASCQRSENGRSINVGAYSSYKLSIEIFPHSQ
jgi:hypothetical protein